MLPDCEEVPRERVREKRDGGGEEVNSGGVSLRKDGGRLTRRWRKVEGCYPREWRERGYVFHFLRLKVISRITFKVEPTV